MNKGRIKTISFLAMLLIITVFATVSPVFADYSHGRKKNRKGTTVTRKSWNPHNPYVKTGGKTYGNRKYTPRNRRYNPRRNHNKNFNRGRRNPHNYNRYPTCRNPRKRHTHGSRRRRWTPGHHKKKAIFSIVIR